MRVLEWILIGLSIVVLVDVANFVQFQALIRKTSIAVITVISVGHILLEGVRWQMGLVYFLLGLYIFMYIFNSYRYNKEVVIRIGPKTRTFVIVCIIASMVLLWMFPVNELYRIEGRYRTATYKDEVVDEKRDEYYGENPSGKRRIRYQVWYPTDDVDGDIAPWLYDGVEIARSIPRMYNAPVFLLDHLKYIKSNSIMDGQISQQEASYPLVLLSHGWTGFSSLHTDLGEMLASHGFIVVSVNHTYGAAATVFSSNELVLVDDMALPNRKDTEDFLVYANRLVHTYKEDSALVLNHLSRSYKVSQFIGNRINLQKIGVLGHSTGGGGVVELALDNGNIDGVLGLDAWVEPIGIETLSDGLKVPSLFIRSEQWVKGPNNRFLEHLVAHNKAKTDVVQIQGANHQDFTSLYVLNPMAQIFGFLGNLNSEENALIQQTYVLTFFEEVLKNGSDSVSLLKDEFPQVREVTDYQVD